MSPSKKKLLRRLLISESIPMKKALAKLEALAQEHTNVLIEGEMGTGRELVARVLYRERYGNDDGLVTFKAVAATRKTFSCAIESGRYEGKGGTLLLKDIGELRPTAQCKLRSMLQSKRGPTILATTDLGLDTAAAEGFFDQELYEILKTNFVSLPPLRHRELDISVLADQLVQEYVRELGREPVRLTARAHEHLLSYPWPGNVAELKQLCRRLVVRCRNGRIDAEDIDALLPRIAAKVPLEQISFEEMVRNKLDGLLKAIDGYPTGSLYDDVIKRVERPLLVMVMKHTGHNQLRAAEILGLNRNTLRRKLVEHGIRQSRPKAAHKASVHRAI